MKIYRIKEAPFMQATAGETLAAIAHDLRSPMCSVVGAAQMALMASRQGKGVDDQLRQILLAVDAMEQMLSSACSVQMENMACTAAQLEGELRALMAPRAAGKAQTLNVDFSALYGAKLSAPISRVLLNLVSNAVKYTQEGGEISVQARREEGYAVFVVSDNGMGMKREFMRRMYAPFERAQESAHLPGRGLGLSIVRRLVRQMGGTICVRSQWGKGTEFTVRIPLEADRMQ